MSSNISDVREFPLKSFLNFFNNHGLFNIKKRPQWKFVTGGSDNYSWTEIYYVTIASAGDSADTNDNMPLKRFLVLRL